MFNNISRVYNQNARHTEDGALVELEIRVKNMNYDKFRSILSNIEKQKIKHISSERQVNSLYKKDESTTFIKSKILGLNANRSQEYIYSKIVLTSRHFNELVPFKASVSSESPVYKKDIPNNINPIFRLKYRQRYDFSEHWFLDMTMVMTLEEKNNTIQRGELKQKADRIRHEIEFGREYNDVSYEVELELKPDKLNITERAYEPVYVLLNMISSNVQAQMKIQNDLKNIIFLTRSHDSYKQSLLNKNDLTIKSITPRITALDRYIYYENVFEHDGYYITDKIDGLHSFLISRGTSITIFTDDNMYPLLESKEVLPYNILEGELMIDEKTNEKYFYIFDIIVQNGIDITSDRLIDRINWMEPLRDYINETIKKKICVTKSFMEITQPLDIKKFAEEDKKVVTDGMIFIGSGPYYNSKLYKWKPPEMNTIDFLAIKSPDRRARSEYYIFSGIRPQEYEQLGLLMLPDYENLMKPLERVINKNSYFPVHFSPEFNPRVYTLITDQDVHMRIVELQWKNSAQGSKPFDSGRWQLVRIREDRQADLMTGKYFGNRFEFAEKMWMSNLAPLEKHHLWDRPSTYFASVKDSRHAAFANANRAIRNNAFTQIPKNTNLIVDLAAGQGADINRYLKSGAKHVLMVDKDPEALLNATHRKYNAIRAFEGETKTKFTYFREDLLSPNAYHNISEKIMQSADKKQADVVVCNFAINYFTRSQQAFPRFFKSVDTILRPGGSFLCMTMNGQFVHDLIKKDNEYKMIEDGRLKYSIIKKYSQNTLNKYGQKISVMLPFSGNDHYDEYLVNVEHIISYFSSRGYTLVKRVDFKDSIPSDDALTDNDKTMLSLYTWVIIMKNVE